MVLIGTPGISVPAAIRVFEDKTCLGPEAGLRFDLALLRRFEHNHGMLDRSTVELSGMVNSDEHKPQTFRAVGVRRTRRGESRCR